jgi:hypothetical protein
MIFVTRMSTPTSKLPLGAMEVKLLAAVGDEQLARHLEQCCTEPWSLRVAPDLASLDPLRASMSPDVILVDGQLLGDPADGGFDRLLTEADATPRGPRRADPPPASARAQASRRPRPGGPRAERPPRHPRGHHLGAFEALL